MPVNDEGQISYARQADTWILRFQGAIRYTNAHALDTFLDTLFAQQRPAAICVDLSDTTSIDSTGIGMLAKIANGLNRAGRSKPVLVSTNTEINELLLSLRLDDVCLIATEGSKASAAETIPATTPSERDVARTVLEAHRLLCGLSEHNRASFLSVVDALANELGDDAGANLSSRRNL